MTEEELKRKIRVRGGHRASAKRIIAAAEESLQVFDPNNPETVIKVKQQLTTLKEKMKTLSVHDKELLSLVKEEEIENEIEQADIFKERLQHSIVSIEMALEKIANKTLAHGSTVSGTSPSSSNLPQAMRVIVTKALGSTWTLDKMLDTVKSELEARERANMLSSKPASKPPYSPHPRGYSSAAALLNNGTPPTCTYCKNTHPSAHCNVVTNPNARKQILQKEGRCYICLRKNHVSRGCTSSLKCYHCGKRHHASICNARPSRNENEKETHNVDHEGTKPPKDQKSNDTPDNKKTNNTPDNKQSPHEERKSHSLYIENGTSILLQTAQAEAYKSDAPETSIPVRVILDSGSQRFYITTGLKDKLNLPTLKSEPLMIKTFNSKRESVQVCDVVQLCIGKEGSRAVNLNAYCVPTICSPLVNQNTRVSQSQYDHLTSLKLADETSGIEAATIEILVGSDQYWQLVTGEVVKGESGPTAMNTKLGWVLSGPIERSTVSHQPVTNLACTHVLKCAANPLKDGVGLENEIKKFWELEVLGIQPEEATVYEDFTNTISRKDGRYEVQLPWKHSHPVLPDNYKASLQRFHSLYNRLKQTPRILEEYGNVIKDQLQKGIVERVNESEACEIGKVHYLPHHAVIRRDKETTRLRVVYDASSKSNGISLNSCLYTGPSLSQNILDILIRFRSFKVAMISDIEKAFLMVSIAEVDRNVLRFLWVDDISKEKPEIIVLRFTRVVFGVSSFLLNATIAHHIGQYEIVDPTFVERFLENIYVDDLSAGGASVSDTYEFYVKSKLRLAEGGFNLRKFMSNSKELMNKIDANESRLQITTDSTNNSNDTASVMSTSSDQA
ncbi:PREDICTED: uncharacterized protein LOC107346460 [Paramuricea clavata]|uniref:PREDICTED: uncharacterized protein LOC107346460 n=1 Tax=Paramuricea clavata TaxID=317549 RepID=A0A7D9EXG0_PARCT|nr:PREDICTED: uncharacterized protein LOC107346460 [Paramuricea clavata]